MMQIERLPFEQDIDALAQIELLEKRKIGRENFYINTALFDLLGNMYRK